MLGSWMKKLRFTLLKHLPKSPAKEVAESEPEPRSSRFTCHILSQVHREDVRSPWEVANGRKRTSPRMSLSGFVTLFWFLVSQEL